MDAPGAELGGSLCAGCSEHGAAWGGGERWEVGCWVCGQGKRVAERILRERMRSIR
jgi:hypothetical protein